jgi:hypothetical protein
VLAPLAALATALAVAGCVSVPNAGPVLSYPVGQQTSGQNGQNVQVIAAGPTSKWTPSQIVTGFLTAAAAIGGQQQVARQYLTPQASKNWHPSWSAYVYSAGPFVQNPLYPAQATGSQKAGETAPKGGKKPPPEQATVFVDGHVSASLSGHGTYAAASSSNESGPQPETFQLVMTGGQWRISSAPSTLLLTQDQFTDDYELRNLYFFDPNNLYLVPDPVYVPLQASTASLMNRLVNELITPPKDWLGEGATQTALPAGTKIIGVTLSGGTAAVNLGGAIATAPNQETLRAQVSAQLLSTLVGSGQGGSQVQSVELLVNGKPWSPKSSPNNPVQNLSLASYQPATGASSRFYYLDSAGYLCRRAGINATQVQIAKIGTGYSKIAVSADGKYLAALRGGSLYMGSVNGPLVKRGGSGYTTISWDPTDNLWTTSAGQILTFRVGASTASPQPKPIEAPVFPDDGEITAVRIAPDGVRVALIIDGDQLTFGAIVWQQGPGPGLASAAAKIDLSPFSVGNTDFTAVTWYGPNDVITLGGPGSTLTEYPVNGGTSTSQPLDQNVDSITASSGQALIAGVARGGMFQAPTLTGAWVPVSGKGVSPTYPG